MFLFFKLHTPGPFFGAELFMACTIPSEGKWRPSMKYWMNWVLANGKQPLRADRLSTKVFRRKMFRARVRKVIKTSEKGVCRTPEQQYSVISTMLEVLVR
jgi:hypothetical protein